MRYRNCYPLLQMRKLRYKVKWFAQDNVAKKFQGLAPESILNHYCIAQEIFKYLPVPAALDTQY